MAFALYLNENFLLWHLSYIVSQTRTVVFVAWNISLKQNAAKIEVEKDPINTTLGQ